MYCNRPNIIIVLADALRPDHLSCYGYHKSSSPNLDNFAEECILFKSAFSASPSTVSSVPSILTGLYPSLHGTGVDGNVLTLRKGIPALPEVLKKEGYTTVGLNTNPLMAGEHGYNRGYVSHFDLFPLKKKTRLFGATEYTPEGFPKEESTEFNQPYVCSRGVNKQVAEWLKNDGRQPFFMWIHYMDTHSPYLPREPYFSQYSNDKSKGQIVSFMKQLNQIYERLHRDSDLITREERALILDCYDSEIRYFDESFNNLLILLKSHNLLSNTVMIVTSDHGEEFWEHGRWGHYVRMYDINLHVPLLLKYPCLTSKGKRISKQVRNIDIFPTIIDILNIKPEYYLSGISLLPFVDNENLAPEIPVLSEGGGVIRLSTKAYIDRMYSLRTPRWKYIKNVTQNEKQLYQLQNDPLELRNVVHESYAQDTIRNLDLKIDGLLKSAAKSKEEISLPKLDSQIIERLKALGYA